MYNDWRNKHKIIIDKNQKVKMGKIMLNKTKKRIWKYRRNASTIQTF